MTEAATNLKTLIQDNYTKAQTRIVELAEKAQASLKDGSHKSRERIEETFGHLSPKEVLDRLKAVGITGLVSADEAAMRDEIATLKAAVASLEKRLDTLSRKGFARKTDVTKVAKRVTALEKGGVTKAPEKTKPAKKSAGGAVNTDAPVAS